MENITQPESTFPDNICSADTSNVSTSVASDSSSEHELVGYVAATQCPDVNNSCSESVSSHEKENSYFELPNEEKQTADTFFYGSKNNSSDDETESNTSILLEEPMELTTSDTLSETVESSTPHKLVEAPESNNTSEATEVTGPNTSFPSVETVNTGSHNIIASTEATGPNASFSSVEIINAGSQPNQQGDCQPSKDDVPDPRIAPKINCPEKIIFCIDLSSEMVETPFKIGNNNFAPLVMVKRLIEMFVITKTRIDSRHEFAIMGFHEKAKWVKNFTNDPKEITRVLDELNEIKMCIGCPLSSVFSLLSAVAVDLPSFPQPEIVPPPFIVRVILIYGRSYCLPNVEENVNFMTFLKHSPYFFFDILYVHETPSDDNKCQEIYEIFCNFDDEYSSYIYEVDRNTTKIHNCMAKLLAHPLLRPLQKNSFYSIKDR